MKKLALLCLILGAARAQAQQPQPAPGAVAPAPPVTSGSDAKPPLPPGPLLKPVPDDTKWTVVTSVSSAADADSNATESTADKAKAGGKAKAAETIIGEKAGKEVHVTDTRGAVTEEKWSDGNLQVIMDPGVKEPIYTTGSIDQLPMPHWVSAENFVDIKTQGQRQYLIFRARILPDGVQIPADMRVSDSDMEKMKRNVTAVIDGDSRLPIAVQEANATTLYKFEPLPAGVEIIPMSIKAGLTQRKQALQVSIRKPVIP